ncbi:MAG: glycoside hydrolase family 9 protein [Acutalibacteraceae bacterium]|nr:glycoside hydrolase family 9 protein [Acutalibacteraceae bacterium]
MEYNIDIAVNQLGYERLHSKVAIAKDCGGEFRVVNADSGEVVFSSRADIPVFDTTNKVSVYKYDFSDLKDNGKYYIENENGKSYPFIIGDCIYTDATRATIKALYFQRCGCELSEEHAGVYKHAACHLQKSAKIAPDCETELTDVTGGWHDAGDFGRYMTPANQCIHNLMYIYELFPKSHSINLNIPESGNGVPDILNEARYEIEWMLKMQDLNGGVHHKLCATNMPELIMPENDESEIYVSPYSLQATAGFAAAMAAASRNYREYDLAFSDRLFGAAIRAYDFAKANIDVIPVNYTETPPCGGGTYGDGCAYDELYWAAAELFRLTNDKKYEEDFKSYYKEEFSKTAGGAYNQGGYGSMCYALTDGADEKFKAQIIADMALEADRRYEIWSNNAYEVAMKEWNDTQESDYYWGSNAGLTNELFNMISVAILLKTNHYDECIRGCMSYIFGRNLISKCYVSGFGSDPIMHPHHRPMEADGIDEPIPGFVSGGPNDRERPWDAEGKPSAACFIDHVWSYTSNEITIYWNTSAAFVLSYLCEVDK